MKTIHRNIRKGFTLLEVLVSTAIMVIIVLTVVSIASDSLRVYDRAVAELSTQSEARGVLDAMDNDFSTAVLRSDGRCWMEIIIPGGINGAPSVPVVGNIHRIDQPLVMLYASPQDRPRWSVDATRRKLNGDVCAVAYRIGQRSPFDMPGEKVQQVYGVYRTIIDSENTFKEALPVVLDDSVASLTKTPWKKSPWDYWSESVGRTVLEYAPLSGGDPVMLKKPLVNGTTDGSCWTMNEQNFIGSNVVSLNIVLWCTSSLPAVVSANLSGGIPDPILRPESALRPVIPAATDQSQKYETGGYSTLFYSDTSAKNANEAAVRYAENTGKPTNVVVPTSKEVHPKDYYLGRLRVFSNRMYPDVLTPDAPATAAPFNYMPYTIRGVEVSVTVLTPDGSKELRGLQHLRNLSKFTDTEDTKAYNRIVYQYGRNYTRYIRVLANGG
jgi:prepilin-type N-terminal cleavage/methylation domain-containing protein